LSGTPVVAAAAGGAMELVEDGVTGWLIAPGDPLKLATVIQQCADRPELARAIATTARIQSSQRFDLTEIARQIDRLLIQAAG
jgi:glycosyltransferase involved in cell wall biosynthesis